MPEKKARVGFSLDFKDSKQQIEGLIKGLEKVKSGFKSTGKESEASLNRVNLGLKSVFKNVATMSSNLRKGIADGQKMSRKQLRETLNQAKSLESRLSSIHGKTAQKFERAEGKKRKALNATMKAQSKALKEVQRVGEASTNAIKKQTAGYGALASILAVKVGSVLRSLVKESALLAAKNEVLGTAMRTVGNNAGLSNAELERTEMTVRKLGISINDTRELISRFAQAQLGMNNATKLARAAQDLAAGSILGSSEALRIMTQSILSLLPRQLRQFGVVVNLNTVYQEQSKILKKSVNDLTSLEKRQGLLNKIFEEAAKRAGAYERSMEDAGKILTTLSSRIIPDTLSMIGEHFLPVLRALVFGFKDLLEWVQKQEGGLKTFIAVIFAVGAAVGTVVGAFTLLSGVVGAATGGFTGFSSAAAATLTGLGPLAVGLAAVTAALILLPKLFQDTATAQERTLETSKGLLNLEVERLDKLEDLRSVLEDQTLTEDELQQIIQSNAKAHKVLIPLLGKEKLVREELLDVLDEEILKSKEVLRIAKERAGLAAKEQLKVLEEQHAQTNKLIIALDNLQKKYGEGKVPVVELVKSLRMFSAGVEGAGGSIDNLKDQMTSFYLEKSGGMPALIRMSQKLGESIRGLKQDVETGFGTAAKEATQSASDMEQALLGLDAAYNKLAGKALKKLPFAALGKEEEEALERIDKALQANLITRDQANDRRLKIEEIFQERFRIAELKFREKLDSIGQSALQKIDARLKKEIELRKGSVLGIAAAEKTAAVARNVVYEQMWADRLRVAQGSVDAIISVMRKEKDLAGVILRQEADLLMIEEGKTAEERIAIKQEFHDKSLALFRASQAKELSVRKQYFDAVALNIQELFNRGIINEEEFNKRSRTLATDLKNFRKQQLSERIEIHKSALGELYQDEQDIAQKLKDLDRDRTDEAQATQDTIREIQQQGMSDHEVFLGDRKRAETLLSEGQDALRNEDFERVKKINNAIKGIARSTSREVLESGKKDAEVLIGADKARIGSIRLVEQAGLLLQESFKRQRSIEEEAMGKVKEKIDDTKSSLDTLLGEERRLEIEVLDEASEQIDSIQKKLDGLKDKTITVTVVTKSVTAGGGTTTDTNAEASSPGPAAPAPAAAPPALADGVVGIEGPGTSRSDSILAALSRGESVINAMATQMFRPILEMMNADPERLRNLLAPKVGGAGIVRGGTSETTQIGDVHITLNGVDSKDVQNLNWRKTVREQIVPELKRLKVRKTVI
jgi:hypothetical protein